MCNIIYTESEHLNITLVIDTERQPQLPELHQEHTILPSVLKWERDTGLRARTPVVTQRVSAQPEEIPVPMRMSETCMKLEARAIPKALMEERVKISQQEVSVCEEEMNAATGL